MTSESSKLKLFATKGVVDYASDYPETSKKAEQISASAKYFMNMRRENIIEILDSYSDLLEADLSPQQSALILNEFLSPTCTLLEFEYRNLTRAGRIETAARKEGEKSPDSPNERWQKQILGQVLTQSKVASAASDCPEEIDLSMFKGTYLGNMEDLQQLEDDKTAADVRQKCIEIFYIHEKSKWFIANIDVDTLDASKKKKKECKRAIECYKAAYSITWRAVRVLVYLEIMESLRSDATQMVTHIIENLNRMLHESPEITEKEIEQLESCANLFIVKYRGGDSEDTLLRVGFEWLNKKLNLVRGDKFHALRRPLLAVATYLAREEMKVNESFNIFQSFYNFEEKKIK